MRPCDVARRDGFLFLGTGADVLVLGGHVELDAATGDLLTSALPPVLHAIAASTEAEVVRHLLEQQLTEWASARPGAGHATAQHAQLLLLEVLRIGLKQDALAHPGWLRLLADGAVAPAVVLLHDDPARAWGLTELANAAGMSRSHFAHRFREAAGQAPVAYLAHWRVRLARQALRTSDATVATLATQLGYASESSFSHAFTRIAGVPPSRYRREHRSRPT